MKTTQTSMMKKTLFMIYVAALALPVPPSFAQDTFFPGDSRNKEIKGYESQLIRSMQQYYRAVYGPATSGHADAPLEAARAEALEAVRKYPGQVNDVLFTCGEYESPLLLALCCDDAALVKALLDAGAIPCPFRACDENMLTAAQKHMEENLGRKMSRDVCDLFFVAQNKLFLLDACIKARK